MTKAFSCPTLAEINTSILLLPKLARLRNAFGVDVGSANGTIDTNDWTVQPAPQVRGNNLILEYALEESHRLEPILGEATLNLTAGTFYLTRTLNVSNSATYIKGQGSGTVFTNNMPKNIYKCYWVIADKNKKRWKEFGNEEDACNHMKIMLKKKICSWVEKKE